ncbi:hypothetical protein B0H14DRAFT_3145806 [Mycena olivaceomarginata]|nr:hypothetical protein B0H14DRAFT_3145806 [Mycena olivaceomarginata]
MSELERGKDAKENGSARTDARSVWFGNRELRDTESLILFRNRDATVTPPKQDPGGCREHSYCGTIAGADDQSKSDGAWDPEGAWDGENDCSSAPARTETHVACRAAATVRSGWIREGWPEDKQDRGGEEERIDVAVFGSMRKCQLGLCTRSSLSSPQAHCSGTIPLVSWTPGLLFTKIRTRFTQQEECNHFEFTYSQCPFIHGFQRPPHLRIILLAARSADRSVRQRGRMIYRGFIFVRGFDTFSGRRPSARFLPLFLSGRDTLLVPGHNLASPQPVKVLRAHRVALGEQQRPLAFPTYRG